MGFLKRIFGRNKWEQVAEEVDMADAVWGSVPYSDPTPSMGASQASPQLQPPAQPSAPPPKFQPGVMQAGAPPAAVPSAPPPKYQPAAAPTAPPPRFRPDAAPAAPPATPPPAPPATPPPRSQPEAVPSIAKSSPVSMSRAPEPTREVILDTIDENDETMPEEFRGCRVIERTKPDGSVEIVYRGTEGFAVDEAAADFLISSYKEELATVTPKSVHPKPRRAEYSSPTALLHAVEPRVVGAAPQPEPHVPVTAEVIDELGFEADLPPELRGARFVRRGGAFEYVTKDGTRLSKDEAESMMEQWERHQAEKNPAPPLVIDELGLGNDLPPELRGAQFVNNGTEFLYITREGTQYSKDMAEGMMERWERDQTERTLASVQVEMPQPEQQVPWAASPSMPDRAPVAVTAEPSGILPRVTPPPRSPAPSYAEPEMVGSSIGDVLKKRAESGLLPVAPEPEPQPVAPEPEPQPVASEPEPQPVVKAAPEPQPMARIQLKRVSVPPRPARSTPAPIGVDPRFPVRAVSAPQEGLEDPTKEISIDSDALAAAQQAAERIRERVLDDEDAAYKTEVPTSRLQQACQSEIDRKRTRHRFEYMLEQSAQARNALIAAWSKSSERKQRDTAKDLDQDMQVLGLFNPMTMREIDLAEFLSVARLRSSERRRTIVTGEVARRVNEQASGDLHQFCMTRAFVDRVAQAAMESSDPTDKILETVLSARLQESVQGVVSEVTKRHGIWLPGLSERLVMRLAPLVRGLVKLARD